MPYLILVAGLIFAGTGLYRFFLKAEAREVKAMLLSVAAIAIGVAALFLAVTGKLPAAIGILVALWPLGLSYLKNRKKPPERGETALTPQEAYEVLGLLPEAGPEEIRAAHLRLMKKVHPDQSGSDWLAKRINAAKDLLLKR